MENPKRRLSQSTVNFWCWLFPISYIIHIGEEYWGGEGYPAYLLRLRGVYLSTTRFFIAQATGLILMTVGILIARRLNFIADMLVVLGGAVLVNGVTHILTAFQHGYGPGLISSIFVWSPLGIATLFLFKGKIRELRYWIAVAFGLGINAAIAVFTMRGGRIV